MDGYDYRDANYPEDKFEDKEFTEDELYDAIAYAFNDGHQGAVNKACEWLEKWIYQDCLGVSPIARLKVGFSSVKELIDDFKKSIEE